MIDFSNMKRVKADKNTTTLKHPKGHEIKIAHNALSKEMREKLMAVPQGFDDGGEVEDLNEVVPKGETGLASVPTEADVGQPQVAPGSSLYNAIYGQPQSAAQAPVADVAAEAAPVDHSQMIHQSAMPYQQGITVGKGPAPQMPAEATQPQTAAPVAPADPGMLASGIAQERAGIRNEAKAVGELGHARAKVLDEEAAANDAAVKTFQENLTAKNQAIDHFVEDQKNGHIDPSRYMASLSTGQKIQTTIGLILGGLGGGLLHQENAALKQLNTLIDRDIEMQKSDLGKSDTLFKANLMKYGNVDEATKMTAAMMHASAALKVQSLEASAQDPITKARAQQLSGQLLRSTAGAVEASSRQKALMAAAGMAGSSGAPSKIDPAKLINLIPEHDQKAAREDLQRAAEVKQKAERAMQDWDVVNQATSPGYTVTHPMRAISGAQSNQLNASIAELNKSLTGRFNLEENKQLAKQFAPSRFDTKEDREMKREAFKSYVASGAHFPTLSQYNIDPQKFESTAMRSLAAPADKTQQVEQQQHAQWTRWAQQNPGNPLAQKYLKKMQGNQ